MPNDTYPELKTLLNTPDVVTSICEWNAARYDQQDSPALTLALLEEELGELKEALGESDLIAILDALGDIFYVAIGGLWKNGKTAGEITNLMDMLDEGLLPAPTWVNVGWFSVTKEPLILVKIALSALAELAFFLDNDEAAALDVVRAICTSNDTKAVKKTASDVKANIDKGSSYIAPTEMLQAIAKRALEVSDVH